MDQTILKILGYFLILLGVLAMSITLYNLLDLFYHPEAIRDFTQSLLNLYGSGLADSQGAQSLVSFSAWPILIILFLAAAKIGFWAIEAGQKLLHFNNKQESG